MCCFLSLLCAESVIYRTVLDLSGGVVQQGSLGLACQILDFYEYKTEYKTKRRRGQESRMSSDDPAQNRGGSRNFADTTVLGMTNACVLIILVRNRWNLQLIILVQLIILQLAYFSCDKCLCLDYFS